MQRHVPDFLFGDAAPGSGARAEADLVPRGRGRSGFGVGIGSVARRHRHGFVSRRLTRYVRWPAGGQPSAPTSVGSSLKKRAPNEGALCSIVVLSSPYGAMPHSHMTVEPITSPLPPPPSKFRLPVFSQLVEPSQYPQTLPHVPPLRTFRS